MCFCYDSLIPIKYKGVLSKRIHAVVFNMKSSVWALVCFLSVLESSAFRLLPWRNTQICQQLDGFPTILLYKVIAYSSLMKSIWLLISVASAKSWNAISIISLSLSISMIFISALSIKSKLFGIELVDNDVVASCMHYYIYIYISVMSYLMYLCD